MGSVTFCNFVDRDGDVIAHHSWGAFAFDVDPEMSFLDLVVPHPVAELEILYVMGMSYSWI